MSPIKVPVAAKHPLDAPTAEEISAVSGAVRSHLTEKLGVKAFRFLSTLLHEPPKADVIEAGFFAGGSATQGSSSKLARSFYVHIHDIIKGDAYEIFTTIDNGVHIDSVEKLKEGVQPSLTIQELVYAEQLCRKNERVLKAAAEVGVSKEELHCDGWSIGWDDRFPGKRLLQCLTYKRYGKDQHLYGHPLDFAPILDCATGEILAIEYPAHRVGKNAELSNGTTAPPKEITWDCPKGRERIQPPTQRHDYLPDAASASVHTPEKPLQLRTDLKPLSVVQPEGVSFKMDGNMLEWQKWKFHVAFHPREGIVLSTVSYADDEALGASKAQPKERPLFYRLSLAEMVVPYGEPTYPHYKKFAFDVGEYGLGYMANSLSLGCDCLGTIQYLDGDYVKHDGTVETIKNAVCIHEEDDGLLWKHTDYREGGRSHNVRGRKLSISMICTVANYEYRIAYNFHQDGNIEVEIKLTGVLNIYTLAEGESPNGHGTEVAPRVNAHYHQHLFSLRVDPHIDGPKNTIMEQEVHPMEEPTGSDANWAGNGFITKKRALKTTGEGVRDVNPYDERSWTIVNENEKHYSTGGPVGYKFVSSNMPRLLAKPDSVCAIRAPFAKHQLWTVPYKEGRLYPAGRYPVQTTEVQKDSVEAWVGEGKENIANEDIVAFFTVGTTHIPRAEDFPVMPAEKVRVMLKPVNFFSRNPCLDVPSSVDAKSIAARAENTNGLSAVPPAACCSN
ncbi:unnamed protein product [Sympodiomycopsis kandeliae]